jgi:hypothetical protein
MNMQLLIVPVSYIASDNTLKNIRMPHCSSCSSTKYDNRYYAVITCVLILLMQGTTGDHRHASATIPVMYSPAAFDIKLYVIECLFS